jgi:hypothetical protein
LLRQAPGEQGANAIQHWIAMGDSSDGDDVDFFAMVGISDGESLCNVTDDVAPEVDAADSTASTASLSPLGGALVICDDACESAAAFLAYCETEGRAPPPWKLDLVDRPDLVEQLMHACFGPDTSSGESSIFAAGAADDECASPPDAATTGVAGASKADGARGSTCWSAAGDHFARVRLNDYVRGGRWEWHQDQVVSTVTGRYQTHKTALLYLSSPAKGGQTEFLLQPGSVPDISAYGSSDTFPGVTVTRVALGDKDYDKLTVTPRRGRCVVFDHNVRHRAMPVIDHKVIAQVKVSDPFLLAKGDAGLTPLYSF